MKSSFSSIVAGLAALLATSSAAPYPLGNEIAFTKENGFAEDPKQIEGRNININWSCINNPIYLIFDFPPRRAEASSFCSKYIRPTSTLTSTATSIVVLTELTTTTATESTTTVATATVATVTELCATPTAAVTCGFEAFGLAQNFIGNFPVADPLACHRLCLLTPNCESFQVQSSNPAFCNLFHTATAGNVVPGPGGGFLFYDRDCTDLLPAGCATPPAKEKRSWPLPTWMPPNPASKISAACTCLITSAPPASTSTVVVPYTTSTTTTDILLTTQTNVQTDTTDVTYVTYTTVTQ